MGGAAVAVGPGRPVGGEGASRACAVVGFEGPPLSSSPRLPVFPSSSPRLLRARQGGLYGLVNWAQEVGGLGRAGLCPGVQGLVGAWIPEDADSDRFSSCCIFTLTKYFA
jgi:hypothetical protein